MAVKVKLDLSKLSEEFTFESRFIKSQEDINTELEWDELKDAIMDRITVLEEIYIKGE